MSGMAIYTILRALGLKKYQCIVLLDMYDVDYFRKSNGYIGAYHGIMKREISQLYPKAYIK